MVCVILLFVLFVAASASEQVKSPQYKSSERYTCKPNCPYSLVKFDGRCFNYFGKELDWASAEAYCLNQGANLVSVHSENEYQTVKALICVYDPKENPIRFGLSNCRLPDLVTKTIHYCKTFGGH